MCGNFYQYVYDQKGASQRFYKNLTEDDILYLEAVTRREYDVCESLLEKYFFLKMPNTKCKHKVWRRDNRADIWEYHTRRKNKRDAGWCGEGVYFYGVLEEAQKAEEYGWWLQGFYINVENPFFMDRDLHNELVHRNEGEISHRVTSYLSKNEIDGILWTGDMREEWCVLKPQQMKRAEVTRDDTGRIIPISYRFDMSNPDNRF